MEVDREPEKSLPDKIEGHADAAQEIADLSGYGNQLNQTLGLTSNARVANTVAGWGTEAKVAGNAAEAAEWGEMAEGMRGPANSMFEAIEPVAGATGAVLGGYSLGKGAAEMVGGEKGQGALDMASGGLAIASGAGSLGVEALGAAACPALAPAAIGAALIASGNEKMKDLGWLGKGEDGKNRSGTDFIADETSMAYSSTKDALGGGVLGTIGGGVAGAGMAIGSGVVGLGADLGAGLYGVGETAAGWAGSAANGVGDAFSAVADW